MRGSRREDAVPKWWLPRISRVSRKETLYAFRAVEREIRRNLGRINPASLTQAEVCQLALRIKDQRDLIRQMLEQRNSKHGRRLLRLNRHCRRNLIALAEKAGLNAKILAFK